VGIVVVVVAAVALAATYLTWTAQRLDRLHARVETSAAALDGRLARRAGAVTAFANPGRLPAEMSVDLLAAARLAADTDGLGADREAAENRLSRALQAAVTGFPQAFALGADDPELAGLLGAVTKAALARRFYNDAVRDSRALRGRRLPRWLHLAGRAKLPHYFEMDDMPLPLDRVVAPQ
jgi:hypothetical protein